MCSNQTKVNKPRVQDGESPLHKAAEQGHLGIVRMLVENGASLSMQDKVSIVITEWL